MLLPNKFTINNESLYQVQNNVAALSIVVLFAIIEDMVCYLRVAFIWIPLNTRER